MVHRGLHVPREAQHDAKKEECGGEFSRSVEEECADPEEESKGEVQGENLPFGPPFREEAVMKVLACRTATQGRVPRDDASRDDDEAVCEGHAEGEECCRDFSSGIDGEDAEHEAEEHRAGIAHKDTGAWEWEIEEETGSGNSCEHEGEKCHVRLMHSLAYGKESNNGEANGRERADLSRDSIEPIEGIHGES